MPADLPRHYIAIHWPKDVGVVCGCGLEFTTSRGTHWQAKYDQHLADNGVARW